jgi:hypothetical protein
MKNSVRRGARIISSNARRPTLSLRHLLRTIASHLGRAFPLIASVWPHRPVQRPNVQSSLQTQKILVLRGDGELLVIDAIDYEGTFWLAPQWIPGPEVGCERPRRLICLDNLLTVKVDGRHGADLELVTPLSKKFLDGREAMEGVSVINNPKIFRRVARD